MLLDLGINRKRLVQISYAFLRKNPENNIWNAMAGAAKLMAILTLLLTIDIMWPWYLKMNKYTLRLLYEELKSNLKKLIIMMIT